jgi:hypothetical protein
MDYKLELFRLRLSKKIVAPRIGLSYSQLIARLNDFVPWGHEEDDLRRIIEQADAARAAEAEKSIPWSQR